MVTIYLTYLALAVGVTGSMLRPPSVCSIATHHKIVDSAFSDNQIKLMLHSYKGWSGVPCRHICFRGPCVILSRHRQQRNRCRGRPWSVSDAVLRAVDLGFLRKR